MGTLTSTPTVNKGASPCPDEVGLVKSAKTQFNKIPSLIVHTVSQCQ